MSTPARAPLRALANRRAPRCPLAVPVRVTVLRSGTAYSIPGRSLNLGEGGISVVLAGEVRPSDPVGVEFLLPDLGLGLQAKAIVRHYAPLRCGFEFQGLTRHQQAVIREWARQKMQASSGAAPVANSEAVKTGGRVPAVWRIQRSVGPRLQRMFWVAAAVLVLVGLLSWWQWQKAWKDLERGIPHSSGQAEALPPRFHGAGHTMRSTPSPFTMLSTQGSQRFV
jgi:hypothetical protein